MEKIFKLDEIDCANCAAKMERAVAKIKGVNDVSINFMTQKMALDIDENNADAIIDEIKTLFAKKEPDCKLIG